MKLFRSCIAAAVALSFGIAAPASAAPLYAGAVKAGAGTAAGEIIKVHTWRRGHVQPRIYWRGGNPWLNGHRGWRYPRRGWYEYDGWWFPPAAFALGTILGSIIVNPPPTYRYRYSGDYLPPEHVWWCDRTYRTYRRYDNTFVPRVGVRAQCASPYWP